MKRAIGVLALAVMGMVGCQSTDMNGQAPTDNRAQAKMQNRLSPMRALTDQQFVDEAGAGGMYEVQAGRIAQSRGGSDNVKMIGQRMVADHSAANDKLMGIVRQLNLTAPSGPTAEQQAMITKLNSLSGADFDKEYLMEQQMAHEQTITLFQGESKGGDSQVLRQFATDMLPTLHAHLDMITGNHGMSNMGSGR